MKTHNPGKLDKYITITKLKTEDDFEKYYECFASVNKASGKSYMESGAEQTSSSLIFEMRYCNKLKDIEFKWQEYRIMYNGHTFEIKNTDNPFFHNGWFTMIGDLIHGK